MMLTIIGIRMTIRIRMTNFVELCQTKLPCSLFSLHDAERLYREHLKNVWNIWHHLPLDHFRHQNHYLKSQHICHVFWYVIIKNIKIVVIPSSAARSWGSQPLTMIYDVVGDFEQDSDLLNRSCAYCDVKSFYMTWISYACHLDQSLVLLVVLWCEEPVEDTSTGVV